MPTPGGLTTFFLRAARERNTAKATAVAMRAAPTTAPIAMPATAPLERRDAGEAGVCAAAVVSVYETAETAKADAEDDELVAMSSKVGASAPVATAAVMVAELGAHAVHGVNLELEQHEATVHHTVRVTFCGQ